jgi:hypothetical protein
MRTAEVRPSTYCKAFAVSILLCIAVAGRAQQPAQASPATYNGCVQKASDSSDTLILTARNMCAVLKGKLSAEQVAGHQIELKGLLSPATKSGPASIQVDSVSSVGQSCSETCVLRPRSRGIHPPTADEVPGSEGGTPGARSRTSDSNGGTAVLPQQ